MSEYLVFYSGDCTGTVAGTVRGLYGDCAGTVREPVWWLWPPAMEFTLILKASRAAVHVPNSQRALSISVCASIQQ